MLKNTTTAKRCLTEVAQKVAPKLEKRYGSLKTVLSAGVLALADQSAENRELYIDLANGMQPPGLLAKQRQKELEAIFDQALGRPGLSTSQKKRLTGAHELLQNLLVNSLILDKKKPSKSA